MNTLQKLKEKEKAAILAHLIAHGGKTINELRQAVPINVNLKSYGQRLTELRREGKVHCVSKSLGKGGGSRHTWHSGPEPEREEVKTELPPIVLAMGYSEVKPKRGRCVPDKHSHGSLARVAVGIQSGFAGVWPDHG